MTKKVKLLAVCASPRKGNTAYLLEQGLQVLSELAFETDMETYYFCGRKIGPCLGCMKCAHNGGSCVIKDDFEELRQKWIAADTVVYAFPVYHISIPAQLKAFLDRLGNAFYGYYEVTSTRHLKTIGALTTGMHFFGGQELAISQIIHHAVLLNCLPVSGDGWQSYTGAAAWTNNLAEPHALEQLYQSGEADAGISVAAAKSVIKRCVETAAIIKCGLMATQADLQADARYRYALQRAYATERDNNIS